MVHIPYGKYSSIGYMTPNLGFIWSPKYQSIGSSVCPPRWSRVSHNHSHCLLPLRRFELESNGLGQGWLQRPHRQGRHRPHVSCASLRSQHPIGRVSPHTGHSHTPTARTAIARSRGLAGVVIVDFLGDKVSSGCDWWRCFC